MSEEQELQVGHIVKIIDAELFGYEEKVEVVEIKEDNNPDGPIGVHFEEDMPWPSYSNHESDNVIRYQRNQLQFFSTEWDLETKANRLFGSHGWYMTQQLIKPLNPRLNCRYKDCKNLREKRVLINCWGTVCEFDVCSSHADSLDGSRRDMLPIA